MSYPIYFTVLSSLSTTFLFLYGFFPVKNTIHVYKSSDDSLPNQLKSHNTNLQPLNLSVEDLYRKHVDKLIFVVIDGLRHDFVSPDHMKYTTSMLAENQCLLKVKVSSPTVTMPRLKSLMTGSISKYIDVILNFGATQISGDSLIYQLNSKNLRTVFYGDDTWLKLFSPESFDRYEGTSSFFVSDYTEVDNNVTRNVLVELNNPQTWDIMILHYLGLDHIGHIDTSFSPLIHTKLEEMDRIVEIIHKALIKNRVKSAESFLLVLTGDHGMRDLGGHGGSTKSETLVPLVILGNDCRHHGAEQATQRRLSLNDKVNKLNTGLLNNNTAGQVDVTSTLAVLLGLPIPSCNTGKLIPELLQNLTLSQLLYAYHYNLKQITENYFPNANLMTKEIFSEHYSLFTNVFPSEDQVRNTLKSYSEVLSQASSHIIKSSTNVDTCMVLLALIMSALGSLITILEPNVSYSTGRVIGLTCFVSYFNSFYVTPLMLNIFVSYLVSLHLITTFEIFQSSLEKFQRRDHVKTSQQHKQRSLACLHIQLKEDDNLNHERVVRSNIFTGLDRDNSALVMLTCMTVMCPLSTSYIENEHNVWMFALNTFLFYILLNVKHEREKCAVTVLLILHRFLRSINMKWLDEEADVSCTLSYWFQTNSPIYLNIFYCLSLISVYLVCFIIESIDCDKLLVGSKTDNIFSLTSLRRRKMSFALVTASMAGSFFCKIIPDSERVSLLFPLVPLLLYLVMKISKHCSSSSPHELLKSLAVSIILFSLLLFKPYNIALISSLCISSHVISTELFSTNRFATTLLHVWLGRVYFFLQGSTNSIATIDITVGYIGQSQYNSYLAAFLIYFNMYAFNILVLLLLFSQRKATEYMSIIKINMKFISINLSFYLFIIYLQRHHLFIWSVFSPKLLLLSSYIICNLFILILLYFLSASK